MTPACTGMTSVFTKINNEGGIVGRIPQEFLDQLLARIDIIEVIDRMVPLKKTGVNYSALCPFHAEKSPSFSVSPRKQFYHCFGCGAHGNAISFLMEYERLEFLDAVEQLAKQAGLDIPRDHRPHEKREVELYELLNAACGYYEQQLKNSKAAIEYLKNRGISGETAKRFKLGFAQNNWQQLQKIYSASEQEWEKAGLLIRKDQSCYDRFRDRLMFPIHDKRGRVIGFGGRVLDDSLPKYLNSPETSVFHKGQELYGLYEARLHERELSSLIIVEGYMDVISLSEHGIHNAVATLGTATSEHHLKTLLRHSSELIFCFDGDKAGRTAAWRALEITLPFMNQNISVQFIFLDNNEDPDSFVKTHGKDAFLKKLSSADRLAHVFFNHLSADMDLSKTEDRARFAEQAKIYIEKIPSGTYQELLYEELAKRTRIHFQAKKTTVKIERQSTRNKPSALRIAFMLLVQNPELAKEIDIPEILNVQGNELFIDVLNYLKTKPTLSTAALLEHWRDHANFITLSKLASLSHEVPEKGIATEFKDAVTQLLKQQREQDIEGLIAKAAQGLLSQDEKLYLHALIKEQQA